MCHQDLNRNPSFRWKNGFQSLKFPHCAKHSANNYAAIPNSHPAPAVNAIAMAPQNVTRTAARIVGAPPIRADNAPNANNATSDAPAIVNDAWDDAVIAATSGNAAPTAKLAADATAACTGRAVS